MTIAEQVKSSVLRTEKPRTETRRVFRVRFHEHAPNFHCVAGHFIEAPEDRSQFVEVESYESDRVFFEKSVETDLDMYGLARRNYLANLRRECARGLHMPIERFESDDVSEWPEESKHVLKHTATAPEVQFVAITGHGLRPFAEVQLGEARPMLLGADEKLAKLVAGALAPSLPQAPQGVDVGAVLASMQAQLDALAARNAELEAQVAKRKG